MLLISPVGNVQDVVRQHSVADVKVVDFLRINFQKIIFIDKQGECFESIPFATSLTVSFPIPLIPSWHLSSATVHLCH